MSLHVVIMYILLGVIVLSCWIGSAGMWRMKEPIQALHYISLPGSLGVIALSIAVFVEAGNSQASWKTLLIAIIVLGFNAVVGHATGRAFRVAMRSFNSSTMARSSRDTSADEYTALD